MAAKMSDDKLDLKLNLDVDVHDPEKAKALREELARIDAEITAIGKHTNDSLKALGLMARAVTGLRSKASGSDTGARAAVEVERDLYAELRKRFAFERRMNAQRKSEDAETARVAREEAREVEARFRAQMSWNTRIAAQRAREEKAAESEIQREVRETSKIRDREARKALADAKALRREQERAASQIKTGAGQVRSGAGRAVVVGGAGAAATAYAANRAVADLTRSGVSVDQAINKNLRLSGLNPKDAAKKGEELRRLSDPIARQLGIKTSEYLTARSEALQAGVDDAIVDAVTEFGSKYARLNDIAPSEVMESSGYGITALSAFGKVTSTRVKELFNIQQHLAATTAASRQGLSSFVRRGLSAGAAAGFSLEDTLAFGGAATSSGADGESAARMLSSVTERLASMPTRAAGIARKKTKSPKDRLILGLPRKLGFGSWKELKEGLSKDAATTMEGIYEGLAAINDPRARLEASEEIFGKEFGSVHAGMAVGHRFRNMRKSVRSKEAGNAIDSGMAIRSGSFDFIMDQIGATVQSLKDGLGLVLKPFWADLRDWALLAPKAFEGFNEAFRQGLTGFLSGLGSGDGTMSGLLNSWFGDPGSFTVNAAAIGSFAKGIGQGIRDLGSAIRSFVGVFAGKDASPEQLGQWSARILGLSAALVVAAPAVVVLGGLATAISGFASIVLGVWGTLKAAGLVGATGAGAASKLSGGAAAGASSGWLAMFSRLFPAFAMPLTMDASKSDKDKLTKRLGEYALEMEKQRKAIERNTEAVEESAKIHKQSYESNDFRGLIHKAALTTSDTVNSQIRSTARAAVEGVVGGSSGPAINESIPGKSIGNGMTGMNRSGIIGRSGGSRSWRNSNPGNLRFGPFARCMGATGADSAGFAIFPDEATGRKAQESLLFNSDSYKNLSIRDAIQRYAPGSDGNDPAGYAADMARAAGVGIDTKMSDLTPDQRRRFIDAQRAREGWRSGTSNVTSPGGNPVDVAQNFVGMGEHNAGREALEGFVGHGIRGAANAWCARFVNASLNAVGQNGTGSAVANSFLKWGRAISADMVQKGDVLVDHRGRGAGSTGGHVGMATGRTRTGRSGELEVEMLAGNSRDAVRTTWERASKLAVRRSLQAHDSVAASQDLAKSISAPPSSLSAKSGQSLGDIDVTGPSGRDITKGIPLRPNLGGGGGNSAGGSGSVVNNITVNAANHSPQEMANAVQRHLQDSMNRRTHDYDGFA